MEVTLTPQNILRRYAKGDRDFSGNNLNGINLSGANLSHTDWLDVNLSKAYLNSIGLTH
ncbi:MAG: pentapeptide repeat-containing protein [Pseudanabaena sp.]